MPHTKKLLGYRAAVLLLRGVLLSVASIRVTSQTGCTLNPTPFTELGQMPTVFRQATTEVYVTGITTGATATTYSPALNE